MKNLEDDWSNRLFLLCNTLANDVQRILPQNFLVLLKQEEEGRFMNSQMTSFFTVILERLCDVTASEASDILDEWLESDLIDLTVEEIEANYRNIVSVEGMQLLVLEKSK